MQGSGSVDGFISSIKEWLTEPSSEGLRNLSTELAEVESISIYDWEELSSYVGDGLLMAAHYIWFKPPLTHESETLSDVSRSILNITKTLADLHDQSNLDRCSNAFLTQLIVAVDLAKEKLPEESVSTLEKLDAMRTRCTRFMDDISFLNHGFHMVAVRGKILVGSGNYLEAIEMVASVDAQASKSTGYLNLATFVCNMLISENFEPAELPLATNLKALDLIESFREAVLSRSDLANRPDVAKGIAVCSADLHLVLCGQFLDAGSEALAKESLYALSLIVIELRNLGFEQDAERVENEAFKAGRRVVQHVDGLPNGSKFGKSKPWQPVRGLYSKRNGTVFTPRGFTHDDIPRPPTRG